MERKTSKDPKTFVIYSLRPFIGALAWKYLRNTRSTASICMEIDAEHGELYDHTLQISCLPGGDIATALLNKDDTAFVDEYTRMFNNNVRLWPGEMMNERTRFLTYKLYRLQIIEMAQEDDDLGKARRGHEESIGRMTSEAIRTGDRVAQAFWGYVLSIFSPPDGIRTTPVFDSIVCYQIAKCAYETDSVPLLTSGWSSGGENEYAMRNAHNELVAYYKRVALHARRAIDTWTMAAARCALVYDVRHLIVQLLWEARHAWAGTGVPVSDNDASAAQRMNKRMRI